MYPTIELVEDQNRQQQRYHQEFQTTATKTIDCLFGLELTQRVNQNESNRWQELVKSIETKEVILTNPDIFHLITHFCYQNSAYSRDYLPLILADFPDLWVFDEFHLFSAHQETAVLNSMSLIRATQQRQKRFLFTSATLKTDFVEQLQQANFKTVEITGNYESEAKPGYRQILQAAELSVINLEKDDAREWLSQNVSQIREILTRENKGRGLIILNSVVMARCVAAELSALLPEIEVREVSGRIARKNRAQTQLLLTSANQPVLVVATSAVDVGVDFRIHLLITESSDSATIIQRLGRLGRHPGFSSYQAFLLISGHKPWIMARLRESWATGETVTRNQLVETIQYAFETPREYPQYRQRWASIQAQGMFAQMIASNKAAMDRVASSMKESLRQVYGPKLDNKAWYAMNQEAVGKATAAELLKFRGGSTLQGGVWDGDYFYTYDLLRLLPYVTVEILDRETFVKAAVKVGYPEEAFPDAYLQVYLRINQWLDKKMNISLFCNQDSEKLVIGELSLLSRLKLDGHCQSEVVNCLGRSPVLTFLVPVNRKQPQSHWEVSRHLHLSPVFGLYRLQDAAEQAYACAFNQDALLLEAMKGHLRKFLRNTPQSLIF